MAHLVLVRHGESVWNKLGKWTGWTDVDLTQKGLEDAKKAGEALGDINFDIAYTATLKRSKNTLDVILKVLGQQNVPVLEDAAVNERDYGDYTGKSKWEVQKEIGDIEFQKLRRSWDYPIPHGESLKQVYERIIPFYKERILKDIMSDSDVILVSSGNSLRALIKYIEDLSEEDIANLEFGIGEIYVYQMDENGAILNKEIRNKNPLAGKQ